MSSLLGIVRTSRLAMSRNNNLLKNKPVALSSSVIDVNGEFNGDNNLTPCRTPMNNHIMRTCIHTQQIIQVRTFGRKAGKMGQHLKKLDEIAHVENKKKKNKRSKDKSNVNNDAANSASISFQVEEIFLAEDENETIFDHGGDNVDHGGDNDEANSLPSQDDVKERMMKVVDAMEDSFRSIRGAEPSAELFDSVQVKAYGAMTPLNAVGQVVITSPTMATISCFDPETCNSVRDAVRDMAGMNFNPRVEDGAVIVPIPRVSAETRKAIVKQLGKVAESTKQRVRRIRRAAQDKVKLGKDGKLGPGISEDDAFRAGKEIDAVTNDCIKKLDEVVRMKKDDIMKV